MTRRISNAQQQAKHDGQYQKETFSVTCIAAKKLTAGQFTTFKSNKGSRRVSIVIESFDCDFVEGTSYEIVIKTAPVESEVAQLKKERNYVRRQINRKESYIKELKLRHRNELAEKASLISAHEDAKEVLQQQYEEISTRLEVAKITEVVRNSQKTTRN